MEELKTNRKVYDESFKKSNKRIYIIRSDTMNENAILERELRFNYFLKKSMKLFNNYSLKSKYVEYLYTEKGIPSLERGHMLDVFKSNYNYVALYIGNQLEFDEFIETLKSIKREALSKPYIFVKAIISDENIDKYILKIDIRNTQNREKLGYVCTDDEIINVNFCYHNVLKYMCEGNHWAMEQQIMDVLIKDGYNIELFGSSFNTRLKYFGCLYPDVDGPFGGLGSYDTVLNTLINKEYLMWNNKELIYGPDDIFKISVGPPSVFELVNNLWILIQKLFEVRKGYIYLGLPGTAPQVDIIKKYKYFKEFTNATEFISFEQNKIIPFGTEELGKIKTWSYLLLHNL